jgi:methylmalonyl-CoA/ethylmalonyl-CoA epimerase
LRKIVKMIKKIEHIGIAVKNLNNSNELFKKLFGKDHYKVESVESEGVSTSFFQLGETKIEILEATNPDSAIAKFIDKKGEGIHHIAYEVDDIYKEMDRLKAEGFEILNKEPKQGADNKLIFFLHPKSTNGVLVELCQERKD